MKSSEENSPDSPSGPFSFETDLSAFAERGLPAADGALQNGTALPYTPDSAMLPS
jgi:hypothetical protein